MVWIVMLQTQLIVDLIKYYQVQLQKSKEQNNIYRMSQHKQLSTKGKQFTSNLSVPASKLKVNFEQKSSATHIQDGSANYKNFQDRDRAISRLNIDQYTHLAKYKQLNQKNLHLETNLNKRRSTFHYQNQKFPAPIILQPRKISYKFSQTTKKTQKCPKQKNIWISKRGTRNFYIMQNQDYVLIDQRNKDYRLYGVLDGHGKYGKMIAQTAGLRIASKYALDQKLVPNGQSGSDRNQHIMKNVIEQTNNHLSQNMWKEAANSGCTFLGILIRDGSIYCFNVGSSRAVLAIKSGNISQIETNNDNNNNQSKNKKQNQSPTACYTLLTIPLSTDQNLSRFDERYRIQKTSAILQQLKDQNGCRIGPQRIWKKGQKYPGIYITRSLGMRLSYQLGVIPDPQVLSLKIRPEFQFVLACSDGFWEVFQSDQAIQFLEGYWATGNLEEGIQRIMNEVVKRWDKKSELMDDVSIVIIKIR